MKSYTNGIQAQDVDTFRGYSDILLEMKPGHECLRGAGYGELVICAAPARRGGIRVGRSPALTLHHCGPASTRA